MQETDADWDAVLDEYLAKVNNQTGYQYERYLSRHQNKVNYTSFVYRADKYTVGNSGVTVFTWFTDAKFGHTYHMRNVGWGHLTLKSNTSKKFIVANTHWSYRTEHSGDTLSNGTKIYDDDLRTQCKNETNTLLSTLKNNYSSIPIFVTGDFNTSLTYFTNYAWLNSSYKVVGEQAKTAGTCITTVPTSGHYDHIFGTGSYTIKRFEFFSSINKKDLLSDHPFVYADLAF